MTRSLLAEPRWDNKAYNAIASHQVNCLFLFINDDLSTIHPESDNWLVQLSYEISEKLRSQADSFPNLISVVQPYKVPAAPGPNEAVVLAKFLGLQNETEPSLHLMINSRRMMLEFDLVGGHHGGKDSDSEQRVTAEEVLQLAKIELLNIEIQEREKWIKEFEASQSQEDDVSVHKES